MQKDTNYSSGSNLVQDTITSSDADFSIQNALLTSIQDLLHKGTVETVQKPGSLGFYSCLFLVPKPGSCWRPVVDLSCLKKFLAVPKFKMETPELIQASFRRNDWVTSIDLTVGYLHIPIHPQSQKYLSLPIHQHGKGSQTASLATRHTNPSIPRQLTDLCSLERGVQQTDSETVKPIVRALGFVVNLKNLSWYPPRDSSS